MQGYPIHRHWHFDSEKFSGGDSLLTALREGWVVINIISYRYWLGGYRTTTTHYFSLKRNHEVAQMVVISNPYVDQFVSRFYATSVSTSVPVPSSHELNGHSHKAFAANRSFVWTGRDAKPIDMIIYTPETELGS